MTRPIPAWLPSPSGSRQFELPVLSTLSSLGTLLDLPGGTEVQKQGTPVNYVFVVESGIIALRNMRADGGQTLVGLRKSPWIIGMMCLFNHKPFPVAATTVTPCVLRLIPSNGFVQALGEYEELSKSIHEMQAEEVYEQTLRITELASHTARERLEEFIWRLTVEEPLSKCRLQLPLTVEEVAQFLAVSRGHLDALFRILEEERLVRRSKGWLLIPDRTRLWRRELG